MTLPTIAIASGKGGTGKTTVAVSLAAALSKRSSVTLLDCDVEEPNAHLLLGLDFDRQIVADIPTIEIDADACTGCGKCAQVCRFNAIAALKTGAIFFPELCHACMGCVLVCPEKCIRETTRRTGIIRFAQHDNLRLVSGLLDIGQAMSTGLIQQVCKAAIPETTTILDAPPGASCPMLATVQNSDFVVLVTEPTPFGLNDLQLAVAALREFKLHFGVVVNRSDSNEDSIPQYCHAQQTELLARIPDSRAVAEHYSQGEMP